MVNATKGLYVSCDIPMAQLIIHMNDEMPRSEKFILHVLDDTHLFVQPDVAGMITSSITKFRVKHVFGKPKRKRTFAEPEPSE